jgi:WD40 repeat protein/nucleoside phosphorylase
MGDLFLFVTANSNEKEAFEKKFEKKRADSVKWKRYEIGKFGLYNAAYIHIDEQGNASPGAIPLVSEIVREINPVGVVMVGIAFGADEKTQKIGDVLVSKKILTYDPEKIRENSNEYKEDPKEAGFQLLNAFGDSEDWVYHINGEKASVHKGAILTGSKLINNRGFKDKLLEDFKRYSPIGGEMEAYGIYSMCRLHGIPEWIIIKAICDWAYNKDDHKEEYQKIAAESAVDYCHHVFSRNAFKDLIKGKAGQPLQEPLETDYFIRSKEQYNKIRSSRFGYIEIDESLFAVAKPKQFDVVVKDSDQQAKTLLETLNTRQGNFVFIGEGGAGKTTSLLQIWEDRLEKEEMPLYIPLNEYNGVKDDFIKNYVETWYGLNLGKPDCPVILLLDGFNEISGDTKKILEEIKGLGARRNTRIVLTSRHNFINFCGFNDTFSAYEIQPLEADVIINFLEKTNLPVIDNWEELLSTPMMLTLYANTCAMQKNAELEKLFPFRPSKSRGEIIYNYLLCQLAKLLPNEQIKNLFSAYKALFVVAPYIAWRMETEGLFSISDENCDGVIKEYLSKNALTIQDRANKFLKVAALRYRCVLKDTLEPHDVLTHLFHILEEQIFEGGELRFSFGHQHFRDFLAAMHIANTIDDALHKEPFTLPAEVSERLWSVYVRSMIGDYYGDYRHGEAYDPKTPTPLHGLMRKLRGLSVGETEKAVRNIIETWRDARDGRIIGEDLTRLDLSHVPMNGIYFSSHNAVSVFDGSFISDVTFLSQGHSLYVNSAVYSPDGRRVLSASWDKTIKEWDRETGQCLRTFEGHSGSVNSVVYSPDGRMVLSVSGDKTIKEWDRETGRCLRTFGGHSKPVTSAVYSLDGRRVLSASEDKTIKEWDRETGQCLRTFEGHSVSVTSAEYSPDGRGVLSASFDNTIKEWDRETGQCLRTFEGHSDSVNSAEYSLDGRMVLSASLDKTIKEWDRETGQCLRTLEGHSDSVTGAEYSPDGRGVLSASSDFSIKEWDRETGKCLRTFEGHSGSVTSAVYNSLEGRMMLSASDDKTIKEWDRETGQCLRTFEGHSGSVNSAEYSPDGRGVLLASADSTIKEWDRETGKCRRTFEGHSDPVTSAEYSLDGRRVLSASWDGTIKEWDRETGKCLRTFEGHSVSVTGAEYSPDGRMVLSASWDKTIKEWDRETGKCLRIFEGHLDFVYSAVYSPDGQRVLSASRDKTIKEWDRETGKCLRTFEGHSDPVNSAEYSPDGQRVLSASDDETIKEWDRETGKCLRTFEGHLLVVNSAVYSLDGRRVLSASFDHTIKEWDRETGQCLRTFKGHSGFVNSAVYSSDGQRVLSASWDKTIKEWDRETGKCLWSSPPYGGIFITGCSFKDCRFSSDEVSEVIRIFGGQL